jgi:hypothetical protein
MLARLNEKGVLASIDGSTNRSMIWGRARNPASTMKSESSKKSVSFFNNGPALAL